MSRVGTHRRAAGAAGFTLVELLIGLAIMALAAMLALPATRTATTSQALRWTASDLAAMARMTRAAAIKAGSERSLTIDLSARRYWADGIAGSRALPAQLSARLSVPEAEASAGNAQRIRFLPGGGSGGGRISISDGTRTVNVTIDWLTGDVHVAR